MRDMMVARDRMLWELHVRSQHDGVWTGKDGRKWTIAGEHMQCDSGSMTRVSDATCTLIAYFFQVRSMLVALSGCPGRWRCCAYAVRTPKHHLRKFCGNAARRSGNS